MAAVTAFRLLPQEWQSYQCWDLVSKLDRETYWQFDFDERDWQPLAPSGAVLPKMAAIIALRGLAGFPRPFRQATARGFE